MGLQLTSALRLRGPSTGISFTCTRGRREAIRPWATWEGTCQSGNGRKLPSWSGVGVRWTIADLPRTVGSCCSHGCCDGILRLGLSASRNNGKSELEMKVRIQVEGTDTLNRTGVNVHTACHSSYRAIASMKVKNTYLWLEVSRYHNASVKNKTEKRRRKRQRS